MFLLNESIWFIYEFSKAESMFFSGRLTHKLTVSLNSALSSLCFPYSPEKAHHHI